MVSHQHVNNEMHAKEESPRLEGLLRQAGVRGANLRRLAALADLTAADVEALAGEADQQAARNPAGLLVTMIDAGRRPSREDRQRPPSTGPLSVNQALRLAKDFNSGIEI